MSSNERTMRSQPASQKDYLLVNSECYCKIWFTNDKTTLESALTGACCFNNAEVNTTNS
jgi:hypothetical protein